MNTVILLFVVLLVLKLGFQLWLDVLNMRAARRAEGRLPEALEGVMDPPTYAKSVAYTLAKARVGVWEAVYDAAILLVLLVPWAGGAAPLAHRWGALEGVFGAGVWGQSLILFAIGVLLSLPGLPWEVYYQFGLEERFGFNKTTPGLFVSDKLKGLLLSAVIGIPLLALILWLVGLSPWWWLWAAVTLFVFQLVMVVVYPMFIMPLFNKFEELPEGDLRERLMSLGDRTGFRAKTILVMDGSKRSAHSNAFFTGFGGFRRIVLFDTLVEQLKRTELEAVLAHEIGHYKLGHIPKRLALGAVSLFASFALLGWLAQVDWFAPAFGFGLVEGQLGPTLLLFGLLAGLVTYWLSPLSNWLSRKHEYEADHFAYEALGNDAGPMIGALRGLSEKNLSNLTPHPVYSAFYYSHPTLLEREAALRAGVIP
ncbi:MAG: M48 family metallopeptidase [Opitutales bacterium]